MKTNFVLFIVLKNSFLMLIFYDISLE